MQKSDLLLDKTVGFIGGGNMAQAIGIGLIKKNALKPNNIWASSNTEKTLSVWKDYGMNATLHNYEVIEHCDIIFLSVKPHILNEALQTCKSPSGVFKGKLYISVIVGISLNVLEEKLSKIDENPKIVRSMPNTPMMVSEGITVYCCSNVPEAEEKIVKTLFSLLGMCEKISESLINSAGGLTGSGPAYLYTVIEALADGVVKKGVPRELATKFAAQVLVGAGKMVLKTEKHPGQLKDEVCSPNGSTIAGISEIERGGVRSSMINAVEAAVNKSDELALLSIKD
ncbi:PREDICTED: pyrroline-5-carboxylate reductase 1, mitochondrial [Ceratosolen solmsi marchali]|uniref:Pyrroline-5-carboxylate reductase n=1 Tax=Ceratosolen solmsi marchali TaxID=326594 RepID=A0AAJ6YL97_9HYME|nr:PREDICTED: pyrroline-5-carboxylate reductase 1, mitochondrial [Ceratosolen solmsi marchali]